MKLYEFISRLERRPGMYFVDDDVSTIENMICGYQQAVMSHDIKNDSTTFNKDFNEYLHKKYNWSTATGWANTLKDKYPEGERFSAFLRLYNEFRAINEN